MPSLIGDVYFSRFWISSCLWPTMHGWSRLTHGRGTTWSGTPRPSPSQSSLWLERTCWSSWTSGWGWEDMPSSTWLLSSTERETLLSLSSTRWPSVDLLWGYLTNCSLLGCCKSSSAWSPQVCWSCQGCSSGAWWTISSHISGWTCHLNQITFCSFIFYY